MFVLIENCSRSIQALLHAFLATRMVLHLKKAFTGEFLSTEASSVSLANLEPSLHFRHNVRGRDADTFVVSVQVDTTKDMKEAGNSYDS